MSAFLPFLLDVFMSYVDCIVCGNGQFLLVGSCVTVPTNGSSMTANNNKHSGDSKYCNPFPILIVRGQI